LKQGQDAKKMAKRLKTNFTGAVPMIASFRQAQL
jgi:hypothetical protein